MACPPARGSLPSALCVQVYGSGEGERTRGLYAVPLPSASYPSRATPGALQQAHLPLASTVVMATREAGVVIGPLRTTPLRHRFPVTEATKRRCPPPSIPP